MEALIDLFWSKYADLRSAIDRNDLKTTEALDGELDPLLRAIFEYQANEPAIVHAQFRLALELLNEEADDRGCVRRISHVLERLVERYISPEVGFSPSRPAQPEPVESAVIDDAVVDGFLDDAVLNRLSDRIIVVGPNYRLLYSNEMNARRLDLPREELIGCHLAELVGIHRFRQEFKERLDQCFRGEVTALTYAEQVDGQTIVIRCRMSPCLSGASGLLGALVVMQETADRRRRPTAA